ncbi:hypothetical protein BV898_19845 [Hypsibius exemplaris]|uniref:Uncharacterized protein n=1 Tax=Hypsibius exemplaris TaxID=2072580 RepID=A0A9X6RPG5_HYPEX|nr:hypothetical protein BV898_19845 [Hypsibius exemplaris]
MTLTPCSGFRSPYQAMISFVGTMSSYMIISLSRAEFTPPEKLSLGIMYHVGITASTNEAGKPGGDQDESTLAFKKPVSEPPQQPSEESKAISFGT